jgi:hypothetical protein
VATAAAQQMFQRASVTSLGPGTRTPQNTTCTEEKPYTKPSKTTPNRPRTNQQHHDPKTHESNNSPEENPTKKRHTPVRSVTSTGQTGQAWAARNEQNPRVNSSKTNSRFQTDFGDIRNTSWALHSQVMDHQNSLNQDESKDFHQEHHKP